MFDSEDGPPDLVPTPLDIEKLTMLSRDSAMTSENGIWTVTRYPSRGKVDHKPYTLIVNHPALDPFMQDFADRSAVMAMLRGLEIQRAALEG